MAKVQTVVTAKDTGERLTPKEAIVFSTRVDSGSADVELKPEQEFQKMIGFGGAFTEAAAYTLSRLSLRNGQRLFTAIFIR